MNLLVPFQQIQTLQKDDRVIADFKRVIDNSQGTENGVVLQSVLLETAIEIVFSFGLYFSVRRSISSANINLVEISALCTPMMQIKKPSISLRGSLHQSFQIL